MKDPDQPYLNKGFKNRKSYLESLPKRYGFSKSFIADFARYFYTPESLNRLEFILKIIGNDIMENYVIPPMQPKHIRTV